MASKISKTEWGLIIGAAAMVDLFQFILDVFVIGVIANRFIDLAIGMVLPFYFKMRGVKMNWKKGGSLVATFLLEFLGIGLDALPLWTADMVLLMVIDNQEKRAEKEKVEKSRPNLMVSRSGRMSRSPSLSDDDQQMAA